MSKVKFVKDIFLNIISVALPIFILQLVSLPIIALSEGNYNYGLIITTFSLITVISFPLGNVLNNTRLLKNETYNKMKITGDFNFLLIISIVFGLILLLSSLFLMNFSFTNPDIVLLIFIVILFICKEYYIVDFRINLNYKKILINSIILSIGYLIGTLLYIYIKKWQIIYLTGFLFSLLYIFKNTDMYKESIKITQLFKKSFSTTLFLYISSLLKNIINHADKIIMLPLLGPGNVAIYYSASIIGKIFSMAITPANTVILSYVAKRESKNNKDIIYFLISSFAIGIVVYIIALLLSPYFLSIFYNEWATSSLKLVKYTTATAIITIMASLFHPYNLKFNSPKWQVYMSSIYLLIFFVLIYFLSQKYGLVGFCIAALISSTINFIMQILIYFKMN